MKVSLITNYHSDRFSEQVATTINNPPYGHFFQEIQYSAYFAGSTASYSALILFGEIPVSQ